MVVPIVLDQPLDLRGILGALPCDSEHRCGRARQHVANWIRERLTGSSPCEQYLQLVNELRAEPLVVGDTDPDRLREQLRELARYWFVPDVLIARLVPGSDGPQASAGHELHCHHRGAVPFSFLWDGWAVDERWAAQALRENEAGDSGRNWAELLSELRPLVDYRSLTQALSVGPASLLLVRQFTLLVGLRVHFMHQPGIRGLATFVKSYDRYSKAQKPRQQTASGRRNHEAELVKAALEQFHNDRVRAIELRPTLDTHVNDLRRKFHQIREGWQRYAHEHEDADAIALALVPSFYKQEEWARGAQWRSQREPWRTQEQLWLRQLRALLELIENDAVVRAMVVGIDAAGQELGSPPRLFAAVASELRDWHRSHGLIQLSPGRQWDEAPLRGDLSGRQVPYCRLGWTTHVGEDFVDPFTGLRHIWEAIHSQDMGLGDRLGHTLAAGLDPERLRSWLDRHTCRNGAGNNTNWILQKPLGVHLVDVAWRLSRNGTAAAAEWSSVAARAFSDSHRAREAADSITGPPWDHRLTIPDFHFPGGDSLDPAAQTPVRMSLADLEEFERIRCELLEEICCCGIVIESCPTSNIAVAGLDSPVTETFLGLARLRVVLGTDDPGLFGVSLADELGRYESDQGRLLAESRRACFLRV